MDTSKQVTGFNEPGHDSNPLISYDLQDHQDHQHNCHSSTSFTFSIILGHNISSCIPLKVLLNKDLSRPHFPQFSQHAHYSFMFLGA
nr:hypothetical transcript [Hymenolepis microstoma]